MKRIFFMFLALLLCVMVQAQVNVEITLNNGNVVKGVTKTLGTDIHIYTGKS